MTPRDAKPRDVTPGKLGVALAVLVLHALVVVALMPRAPRVDEASSQAAPDVAPSTPLPATRSDPAMPSLPYGTPIAESPPSFGGERRDAAGAASAPHWSTHPDEAVRVAWREGQSYGDLRERAVTRMYDDMFGEAIGAALRLPIEQSWPMLEALARDGDRLAGDALANLATQCHATGMGDRLEGIADRMSRSTGARPDTSAFVAGALRREGDIADTFGKTCRAANLGFPRLRELLGETPRGGDGFDRDVIERFRARFGEGDMPREDAEAAITRQLLGARTEVDADTLATMLPTIAQSPRLLDVYANCLAAGCAGMAAAPPAERAAWMRQAAMLGGMRAMDDLVQSAEQSGNRVEAYGWTRYREWLQRRTCTPFPSAFELRDTWIKLDALANTMSAADRARAEALGEDLIVTHGPAARTFQRCAD